MRWPWQPTSRTTACPQPRLLPSATAGVPFEALFTITWRPRRNTPPNLEEIVRAHVHTAAAHTTAQLDPADLPAAQDVLNCALATPDNQAAQPYRLLAARASLRLSSQARQTIAQHQADDNRIRRLRFLKAHLYDHPDLVVLDRLEHQHPGALHDDHVAELQRLARLISACDRWWSPMLQQWERLGQGFRDTELQHQAMLALLDSLKALNGGSLPPALGDLPDQAPPPKGPHP